MAQRTAPAKEVYEGGQAAVAGPLVRRRSCRCARADAKLNPRAAGTPSRQATPTCRRPPSPCPRRWTASRRLVSLCCLLARGAFDARGCLQELDTDRVNYADDLTHRPKMVGAYVARAPFELSSGTGPSTRPSETKFQRFQRLQADVKALLDEISLDVAASATAAEKEEEPLPSYVHKELRALHQQLNMALADDSVQRVLKPAAGSYTSLVADVQDVGMHACLLFVCAPF